MAVPITQKKIIPQKVQNFPSQNNNFSLNEIKEMGRIISQSGLFGVKSSEQAIALMLIAQAEGKHPAMAAQEYNIIQGRPALKADAMLARYQQAGGKVQWKKYTDTEVSAIFSHPQGGEVEVSWTIERAQKAGLTGKDNWKKYPRQMLKARVISEGVRLTYPAIAVGIYTPEEVMDFEEGFNNNEEVEITPEPQQQPQDEIEKIRQTLNSLGMDIEVKDNFVKVVELNKGSIYQNRGLLKDMGFQFHGSKKIWWKKII